MLARSSMNGHKSLKMPAEWEPHEGTWLAWPHNQDHWPGNFAPIPFVYAQIIRALAQSEKVFLCVNDPAMEINSREVLRQSQIEDELLERVIFFHIPTDASWSRDHGPIFVKDEKGKPIILDWVFNSWGAKYPPWNQDDDVPKHVARILELPLIEPGIVLEGGSIDVNGRGTLLTTEQCLLNRNRNPHLSRSQIEEKLNKYLGAANVLWLKEGIEGDDTDGHIDDIARFVNPTTIVCVVEKNGTDPNCEILQRNYEDLKRMKDQDGSLLNVVTLPMPDPVFYEGNRLPASYANFYIANRSVLIPIFHVPQDREAIEILQSLFPERNVIGIDCVDLVWGLGTIHCSTQQQPRFEIG
jgi:agmatine deiminase